jgi:SAM-dependent methyltransferase
LERLNLSDTASYSPAELAIHTARYLPLRDLVRDKRVLDLACGEGLGAFVLRDRFGARQVVGVDVSAEAIGKARATFRDKGLVFQVADAVDFLKRPELGRFDVVTCVETIEHLPDPDAFLSLIRHAVRDAGVLFITCPNDDWYFGSGRSLNEFHLNTFTADGFFAAAEVHLGAPEHRFLGTVLSGFATYPLPVVTAATYGSALQAMQEDAAFVVPASASATPEQALADGSSLYYAGLWNYTGEPISGHAAFAAWPCAAEFRQPAISQLPRALRQDGAGASLLVAHAATPESRAAAERIVETLSDRIAARAVAFDPGVAAIEALYRSQPAQFVHFADVATAASLFRAIGECRPAAKEVDALAWAIARPVTTFGVPADEVDDPAFWHHSAYLFDGYLVDGAHPRVGELPAHKARPEILQADDDRPIRTWLRLMRRSEVVADAGLHSVRFAEVRRLLRATAQRPAAPKKRATASIGPKAAPAARRTAGAAEPGQPADDRGGIIGS